MPYERNEMAKHLDIYNLAHDGTFRKRVQCAAYLAGRDILAAEVQSAGSAPDGDLDLVVASVWGEVADS